MAFNILFDVPTSNLQAVVETAQSIELNRTKLVATTMARSGRVFVAGRNWVRPWRFTITPAAYYKWPDWRQRLEPLINGDRLDTHEINLTKLSWAMEYMGAGSVNSTTNKLTNVTIQSVDGNEFVFTGSGSSGELFKPGDIFQPEGHTYPYVVNQYFSLTKTAVVDRGYLEQDTYNPIGQSIVVGKGVTWNVVLTKMPTYKLLPGQLMAFSGDFEAVEVVA